MHSDRTVNKIVKAGLRFGTYELGSATLEIWTLVVRNRDSSDEGRVGSVTLSKPRLMTDGRGHFELVRNSMIRPASSVDGITYTSSSMADVEIHPFKVHKLTGYYTSTSG